MLAWAGAAWAQAPAVADSVTQARVDSLRRNTAGPRLTRPARIDSLRRIVVADSARRAHDADSLLGVARADSARRAASDSVARARRAAPNPEPRRGIPVKKPFDEPRWVMLRSLAVPGWGQLHNGSWIKALLVAGVEVNMGRQVVDDLRALERIQEQVDAARRAGDTDAEAARVNDYNLRLDELTRRQWWLGAAVAYALLDAYIDAHFRNFDAEFEYDPALPGGEPTARVRLSYRWSF